MALTYPEPSTSDTTPAAVRAFIIGAIIGAVIVGVFCGGVSAYFGADATGAIAVGAFCAFWGGPGFGGMMGFVIHQARTESAAAAHGTGRSPSDGR
ncbi:MAG: hypothetical protein ACYC2O_03375 [Microthrixaceae bacterium]